MRTFNHDIVVPNKNSSLSKKDQVAEMFDSIAGKYDFLNRLLSAGIDVRWRKKALGHLKNVHPLVMLDVATGTADVAILASKVLQPDKIIGIDISEGMLEVGRIKITKSGLSKKIELRKGDSELLDFSDNYFDAVTISFGVRNFQNLTKGLEEIKRVLKPGGKIVILEFSKPTKPVIKNIYSFYMKVITPAIGKLFSKNKNAYSYLDESIKLFPEGHYFVEILNTLGYSNTYCKQLSLGICSIYCGTK